MQRQRLTGQTLQTEGDEIDAPMMPSGPTRLCVGCMTETLGVELLPFLLLLHGELLGLVRR